MTKVGKNHESAIGNRKQLHEPVNIKPENQPGNIRCITAFNTAHHCRFTFLNIARFALTLQPIKLAGS